MILTVFLASAILSALGFALSGPLRGKNGPRPDGVAFMVAVLLPLAVMWYFAQVGAQPPGTTPDDITNAPIFPAEFVPGLKFALLCLGVYVLSALRGLGNFPAWIADGLVIVAAFLAVNASPDVLISLKASSQGDAPTLPLSVGKYNLAPALTIAWIWGVARLSASLARLPAVAPGFLGLVAGLILLLVGGFGAGSSFAPFACASLCGAGLTMFVFALKKPDANLGWSATLAGGFLLGIASALGVLNTTLPAIICLAALALGLPLLNVSIVSVRAKLRGKTVDWTQKRVRLDEALARRGVAPRKIATLYFALGLWGCTLAFFASHWFFAGRGNSMWMIVHALFWLGAFVGGGFVFYSIARVQMRRRAGEDVPDRLEAFGIEISPVSMREALDKIEGFIENGSPHHVVTSDANAVLTSRDDPEYTQIIRRAALITPDGFGLVWGARLIGLPIYERVTGVDMVTGICERAAKKGYRLYVLGSEPGEDGKPGVAETAARNLAQKYPGANFVGTHHGFWRREGKEQGLTPEQADARMADEIRRATPDVLFVAMGIPMQEKFIAAQLERMNVPVCLGVGGSFDVYSGKFNRAPLTVQRLGMEWLYRVWIDPSRWKRMGYVPKFMIIAVKTWLLGDKKAADVY